MRDRNAETSVKVNTKGSFSAAHTYPPGFSVERSTVSIFSAVPLGSELELISAGWFSNARTYPSARTRCLDLINRAYDDRASFFYIR